MTEHHFNDKHIHADDSSKHAILEQDRVTYKQCLVQADRVFPSCHDAVVT